MNSEVNNINNNVQPNMPDPTVNQVPTAQPEQVSQTVVNPAPVEQVSQTVANPTPVEQFNQTVVNPTPEPAPVTQDVSQTVTPAPAETTQTQEQSVNNVDPMSAVANLNKDEAMEEALSHTTQYSPFEAPKQEVNQEVKKTNNKSAYIFIGIIFAIMLLFIIFLPQISNLFGWV